MEYEHSPESSENPPPELSIDPEASEYKAIEKLIKRFEVLNVQIRYGIFLGDVCVAGRGIDEPLPAASTGKLPLACMVIDRLNPEEKILIKAGEVIPGGSSLDHLDKDDRVTVNLLLQTLLRDSSNTAYSSLGVRLQGPDSINAYYEERGWSHAQVDRADNGRAIIGKTTVEEVYAQLHAVLYDTTGDAQLRATAQNALRDNKVTRYGIRQSITPSDTLLIYNKTGEHGHYRLDTGIVQALQGPKVGYAVLAEGIGMLANWGTAELTADIARLAGASDVPRAMASRAIHW